MAARSLAPHLLGLRPIFGKLDPRASAMAAVSPAPDHILRSSTFLLDALSSFPLFVSKGFAFWICLVRSGPAAQEGEQRHGNPEPAHMTGEQRVLLIHARSSSETGTVAFSSILATLPCSPIARNGTTATVTATRPVTSGFPNLLDGWFPLCRCSLRPYASRIAGASSYSILAPSRTSHPNPANIGDLFSEGSLNPYTNDPYAFD